MTTPARNLTRPPPAKGLSGRDLGFLLGGAVVVATAAVALYFVAGTPRSGDSGGTSAASTQPAVEGAGGSAMQTGLPPIDDTPIALTPGTDAVVPAILVDVYAPSKLRQALLKNPWMKELAASPLYAGFVGSWQGFFGTRGEDLGDRFSGTVFDLVGEKLLGGAFRVVFFGGEGSARTPALVLQAPSQVARDAYALLDGLVKRGSYHIESCPAGDEREPRSAPTEVVRWLAADRALYASLSDDRLVLAAQPMAVVQGVCANLPEFGTRDGVDLEVELRADTFGRGAQALNRLLGLESPVRLALAVDGERLVPRGLRADKVRAQHLLAASLDDKLLKLVPADVEVLTTLQLDLPLALDTESLKAFFEGADPGPREKRQIALMWTPHGTRAKPNEVAIVWSRVADAEALDALFSGGNALSPVEMCDALVLSSTADLRERLSRTCHGQSPSVLSAAPSVVSGLKAAQSIGVTVNVGRVLWGLTEDAYRQEAIAEGRSSAVLPRELDDASRLLLTLPILGFTGVLQGTSLQPGGFRS
ncbi:MAG: hypothetical protein ABIJ09_07680 [Pseudomonadota bacterium]